MSITLCLAIAFVLGGFGLVGKIFFEAGKWFTIGLGVIVGGVVLLGFIGKLAGG